MDKLILPKGVIVNIPTPIAKKAANLSTEELVKFMKKHGFSEKEFAEFMGVTPQGVRLWVTGQREMSVTNTRIIRMLEKYPQLIPHFKES